MCDVDDVNTPWGWSEKWRRARKSHRCVSCCADTIAPGDLYWHAQGNWDGDFDHVKHCAPCHAVYEFLCAMTEDIVNLDLDCGETLDDPDDPAHHLAFWTRADGQLYAQWSHSIQHREQHHAV